MHPEAAFYQIVGVRKESPKLKWQAVIAFELYSKVDRLLHGTKIWGSLPTEGPILVVSMHTSSWDIAKGYEISKTGKRVMRGVARETLLNPDLQESEEVLERTGKKSDPLTNAPRFIRNFIAAVLNGVDAIGVPRGASTLNALRPTIRVCTQAFENNQIVGIFIQETRVKENDLRDLMKGPAFLARMNPDVPICPVAVYSKRHPHKISIGQPFTANEAKLDASFRTDLDQTTALTLYIADQIANIAEEEVKIDWFEKRREEYIQKSIAA